MTLKLGWRLGALKLGVQDAMAYRGEFLFETLGSAFVPAAIQIVLWTAIFAGDPNKTISGQSLPDLLTYTLVSILFSQIRGGNQDFDLAEMIRSGSLSQTMLRPVSPIELLYYQTIATKLFVALGSLLLGLIAAWIIPDGSVIRLLGAMVLALIGNIIHFQMSAALASISFYWEESYGILMVKNMIVSLLSGELIPLTFIPVSQEWILKLTPFHLYVFTPTQFAIGKISYADWSMHVATGCLWILFFWAAIRISWGIGLKRYTSLGG